MFIAEGVQCVPSEQAVCSARCKSETQRGSPLPRLKMKLLGFLLVSVLIQVLLCLSHYFVWFIASRLSSSPHLQYGSTSSSFCFLRLGCFITGWAFQSNLLFGSVLNHSISSGSCISSEQTTTTIWSPPTFSSLVSWQIFQMIIKLIWCWLLCWLMWVESIN